MSSDLCSARTETLREFAETGMRGRVDGSINPKIGSVNRNWDAMLAACEFRDVEGNPGPELVETMSQFRANEAWVRAIADVLDDAPVQDGVAAISSSELTQAIDAGGTAPDANIVDFDPQEIVGMPVTSGLVNDPINAANGNFVHADRDLILPGFGAVLDVVRAYNSFNVGRTGAFGRGWTSTLDVALDPSRSEQGLVHLAFTDGSVIPFAAASATSTTSTEPTDGDCGGSGGWQPNVRRRLRLERTDVGWTVTRDNGRRRWFFDDAGQLVGGEEGAAGYTVARGDDGSVVFREMQSDRWVRYEPADGLVRSVTTSDGRACRYHYDDAGNCVRVERSVGGLVYEIDDGFLVAMFDADGVPAFTNTYDDTGRVLAQDSPHGRHTTYAYLDNGGTRVTDDEDGPSNLLFHDDRGNLTAMYGSDGAAMRASYDQVGRVVRHIDREGGVTEYRYHPDDELDLIVRKTDPDGLYETRDYDERGRVVRQIDRSGAVYAFTYEGRNRNPNLIAAPEDVEILTTYDHRELPTSVTDGDGVVTRFEWDADGQLIAHVNGVGERTTFTYDRTGQLVAVSDPTGRTAEFDLDPAGRVRAATDVAGLMKSFEHSPAGRILSMTTPGPGSWEAVYGQHGDLVSLTDAAGGTVEFDHDSCGHVRGITGPDGSVTLQEWDGLGQLTSVTDPAGNTATQTYDKAGRSLSVTHYDGRTFSREVDPVGRTTAMIGPDGASSERTYHPNGQLASLTNAVGEVHRFEIDGLGRLAAVIDPTGGRRTYEYSAASRLIRQVTPGGREYRYAYDGAGRLTAVADADGTTLEASIGPDGRVTAADVDEHAIDFTFDAAGRVTSWTDRAGGASTTIGRTGNSFSFARGDDVAATFDYDPRGLLARVSDPGGVTTEFERDLRGRIVGASTGDHSVGVAFDLSGAVAEVSDGEGRIAEYRNTSAGRLEQVLFGDSGLGRTYHYDGAGRVESIDSLGGEILTAYVYDRLGRLAEARSGAGRTTIERDRLGLVTSTTDLDGRPTRYDRDADGLVTARVDDDGNRTDFRRSAAGKLEGFVDSQAGAVPTPGGGGDRVRRDRAGRIAVDAHGRSYSYDAAGRLEQALSPSGVHHRFTYNDLGLLATDFDGITRRTFSYNIGGQLAGISGDDGSAITFSYDAAGRRTGQTTNDGSRIDFVWNDLDQLIRIDRTTAAGETTSRRIRHSGLGRVEQVDDTSIGWDDAIAHKPVRVGDKRFLRSGLSVREATPDGEWTDGTYDDPWGPADGEGTGIDLGYRGELTVDGMVFMGDRVYDPNARAFLSKDPRPPRPGANGAFGSVYAYAWCDPVNFVDPTGREPISIEEFEAWKVKQESNRFQRAGQAMLDDPWGSLAMVGVVAVGVGLMATGVGGPIGAGILIGAAASAGMGLATDNFNPRSVAIGGAFGAVGGSSVAGAFAAGVGESVATQVLVDGRGLGDINLGQALFEGTIGAVIPAAGNRIDNIVPSGTADDLVPSGLVDDASRLTRSPDLPMSMDDYVQNHGGGWGTPGSVTPGGHIDGDRVLTGHGGVPTGSGSVDIMYVPEGTSIATYGPHGQPILDSHGFKAEMGTVAPTHVYGPGDVMPDYTLFPVDLKINQVSASDVVLSPTRLSQLVGPDEGVVHWAACLDEIPWLKP